MRTLDNELAEIRKRFTALYAGERICQKHLDTGRLLSIIDDLRKENEGLRSKGTGPWDYLPHSLGGIKDTKL